MNFKYGIFCLFTALIFGGCASERPLIPLPLDLPKKVADHSSLRAAATVQDGALATRISETPKPPVPEKTQTGKPVPPPQPPQQEEANITLAFEQMPLPTLIQVVYGTILKMNVNVDPKVVDRKDLVTLRTGAPQTPSQVADTIRLLLKSYGIAVMDIGGLVRIVPDGAQLGYLPEIRRGRALPETPLPLRPIFQLVELQAVRTGDVASWLRTIFANKVDVKDDQSRNAVLLSGKSDDVMAALEAIHVLDQPAMKGRQSARITPAFWTAEELAKRLTDILQAEGYSAGTAATSNFPVTLLPIPSVNSVIIFAASPVLLEHVVTWAKDLDKPTEKVGGSGLFSYQVQYTDAQRLAVTLEKLLSGAGLSASPAVAPSTGTAPAAKPGKPVVPSKVVVDQGSNTIIFQGSDEDYSRVRNLLQALDKPAKEALIEVTVAEVSLKDNSQLGIEWLIKEARLNGDTLTAGTLGGLSIGTAGFTLRGLNSAGDTRLLLNALASSNRATILSSPRVVARNGETATIQVGKEEPYVASQVAIATTGTTQISGVNTVPQTVQYRNTGVILNVKPVIHSGDQVDLEVSQEVSAGETTTTGVSTSPTFSTRKVQTKLSLKSGTTVLLGGLISTNKSEGNSGIPLLKDIPALGQLFRNNTDTSTKTELIVLITPYIIGDDNDAQLVTDAFRKQLGTWAQTEPVGKPKSSVHKEENRSPSDYPNLDE